MRPVSHDRKINPYGSATTLKPNESQPRNSMKRFPTISTQKIPEATRRILCRRPVPVSEAMNRIDVSRNQTPNKIRPTDKCSSSGKPTIVTNKQISSEV